MEDELGPFKGDRWLRVQQVCCGRATREVLEVPKFKLLMREVSIIEMSMGKVPMLRVPTMKVLKREPFHLHWKLAL